MSRFGIAAKSVADVGRYAARLGRRRRPAVEVALVVLTYLLYDSTRGLFGSGRAEAVRHAREVARLERWTSLDIERRFQTATHALPGLDKAFSLGYVALHLGVTVCALMWLYRRRRGVPYASLRTALVIASFISLAGFALFPTAPPRLAGIGIADTVTQGTVDLNSSSLHWLYNPFAALPSVHCAYALLVGLGLITYARHPAARAIGVLYPSWVAAEVLATGNHFVLDVVAGAFVGTLSWWLATRALRGGATTLRRVYGTPAEEAAEPVAA